MKNNQFAKIDNKKDFAKHSVLLFLISLAAAVFSVLTFRYVHAYFTAQANVDGDISFGSIEVNLLNKDEESYSKDVFEMYHLNNLVPGSTVDLSGIKIENTGTFDEYVLINLDVTIPGTNVETLHYNKWFNADGMEVNIFNMQINEAKATFIPVDSTATTYIKWKIPSEAVGDAYKGSTANVKVSAYGTQTLLPEAKPYADKELYASYFICKNATIIAEDNSTSYSGDQVVGEPLKEVVGKNKINVNDIFANSTYYSIENGSLTVKASDARAWTTLPTIKLTADEDYTISVTNATNIDIRTTSGELISRETKNSISFKAPQDGLIRVKLGSLSTTYPHVVGNIQIEEGKKSTAYVAHSLVKDAFDVDSQTLTRNVKSYEFTGDEGWELYPTIDGGIIFYATFRDRALKLNNSICSHFRNINQVWSQDYKNSYAIYSDHATNNMLYFRAPNAAITTPEQFSEWLASENAKGTPVTLWYEAKTSTTEKILTSKNLFEGEQLLQFTTSSSDNNISQAGTVLISSQANKDLANMELGKEVFEYVKNKPLVASFKMRRYTDDEKTLPRISVAFRNGSDIVNSYMKYADAISADGQWHYYWVTIPAITSVENYESVTNIRLQLADYSSPTYVHYEIHNLQIEVGTAPTDFENYDSTEYARVNGVALRQIRSSKDTYNPTTKTISRKVLKLEFTGFNDSGRWLVWDSSSTGNSIGLYYSDYYTLGEYGYPTFTRTGAKSSHFTLSQNSHASQNDSLLGTFAAFPASDPPYISFKVPFSTLSECIQWLNDEYVKGKPVTVWFAYVDSVSERI